MTANKLLLLLGTLFLIFQHVRLRDVESKIEKTRFAAETDTLRVRRMEFVDANNRLKMVVGALPNGAAGLFIPDPNKPILLFAVNPEGQPVSEFHDIKNGAGIKLTSWKGEAIAEFGASKMKPYVALKATPTQSGVALADKEGRPRAETWVKDAQGMIRIGGADQALFRAIGGATNAGLRVESKSGSAEIVAGEKAPTFLIRSSGGKVKSFGIEEETKSTAVPVQKEGATQEK